MPHAATSRAAVTAFVLSGGASLGAVQVGMLQALSERDITPDLIVGSSVGALNGAWFAGHPDRAGAEALAAIWSTLRRGDIFPMRPLSGLLGLTGRRNHLVSPHGLERVLHQHLPFRRLEEAEVPVHVVATEVSTGRELLISSGETVPAILASAAIPGVFPPVRVGSHELMDAGVVNNTPISHAVHLGATIVYVLPTGYACDLAEPPRSALGMVLHALTLLIEQQLMRDIHRFESAVQMHVIPPLCPLDVAPIDFGQAPELIARARHTTHDWLSEAHQLENQSRLLSFHHHDHTEGSARTDG